MTFLSAPGIPRYRLPLLLALTLLAASGAAQAGDDDYFPRFARQEQPPHMLPFATCAKPEWPSSSLRNGETGTVMLRFTIAPNGRVVGRKIEKSSGYALLDQAAAAGMANCKFAPASIDGKPVQGSLSLQYVWTIE